MRIEKPIIFFDIESTGLDTNKDRIVELCIIKLTPDIEDGYTQEVKTRRFNPLIKINPEAAEVHGISNEDVADLKPFSAYAKNIHAYIAGCDVAGFNSNRFDIPMLVNEFGRCGITWDWRQGRLIDVGNLYKIENPRTLSAAYKQYVGVDLEDAHDAEIDVQATIEVFMKMCAAGFEKMEGEPTIDNISLHSNFGNEIIDLDGKFIKDENGAIIINFGKHKGKKATSEKGFVRWMLDKDFSQDTKNVCWTILK